MEVVDFYPKTFQQIEKQDNPAFGDDECVMIVREPNRPGVTGKSKVLHIKPDPIDSVTEVALFWRQERAIEYAKDFTP